MQLRLAMVSLGVSMVAALAGCPDASDRYQEFGDRIIDASVDDVDGTVVTTLPNVNGTWLLSVRPNLPADLIIRFRVTATLTRTSETTGLLALDAQPLHIATGEPIGEPLVADAIEVGSDARFASPLQGELPGEANPVSGAPAALDATLEGSLRSANFLCDTLSGTAGALPLAGTTWGAVRIIGTELPDPAFSCDAAP